MKKLIAIILLLCMIVSITACKKPKEDVTPSDVQTNGTTSGTGGDPTPQPQNPGPTIVVPEYKDYGRGTVNFSTITYTRPGIQALASAFDEVAAYVSADSKSADEQISDIRALEPQLESVKTMCALVDINQKKNSANEFWRGEAAYVGLYYPLLTQSVEKLLAACARSEHKEAFEEGYFGYSLDKYASDTVYTDEVVALMQREAELESQYSSLSTATVEISYKRIGSDRVFEGTVDEVKLQLKEYFGNDQKSYNDILPLIDNLYKQELSKIVKPLYVELLKVRRLIADELGYGSYVELAYGNMAYGYSDADMMSLLSDIGVYIREISSELQSNVFGVYFQTQSTPAEDRVTVINNLYKVYSELGGSYKDAYSYMLQHGLYDISDKQENRYDGAFSTYLDSNESPYLFVTTTGFIKDYNAVAHEFGHFLDAYVNLGSEDSLMAMEVSSQALELLTLLKLKSVLYTPEYKYLEYYTVYSFLKDALLTQSFYSAFEHLAYSLDYDKISEAALEAVIDEAYTLILGEGVSSISLSDVIIPHTVLYPCYVESYVTSAFISLDIFFSEVEESGEGFRLYEGLLKREDKDLSFEERLVMAGIDSPFSKDKVKDTANSIYHYLTGRNYYEKDERLAA